MKATNGNQQLTLVRIFKVPKELVFNAWTDQKQLKKWCGPSGFTSSVRKLDVRSGGGIYIDMTAQDGGLYSFEGVFHEIVEQERIVFSGSARQKDSMANLENLIAVTFDDYNGQTRLILNVVVVKATPQAAKLVAGMEAACSQSLDRLNDLIANF